MKNLYLKLLALLLIGLGASSVLLIYDKVLLLAPAAAASFTFAESGDIGSAVSRSTNASLAAVADGNPAFFLVVGDFSYEGMGTERVWCSFVTGHLGSTPVVLEGGNHEDDNGPDGRLDNFLSCLPNRLTKQDGSSAIVGSGLCGAKDCYGREYYFDYPPDNPIARFILLAADEKFDNVKYEYATTSVHYEWLDSTIKDAKSRGLWVIVGMHKLCISAGVMQCAIGPELARLLIKDRVDIVLQGHDHLYERSKQLTCIGGNPTRTVDAIYDPSCVANDGHDGIYTYGAGTIFLVNGQFGGRAFVDLNCKDPEAQYFAKAMGRINTWDNSNSQPCNSTLGVGQGFSQYTVTPNSVDVSLVTGRQVKNGPLFTDHWSIVSKAGSNVGGSSNTGCIPLINCSAQDQGTSIFVGALYLLAIPASAGIGVAVALLISRRRRTFTLDERKTA